ncbi:hypothetical protein ACFYXM_24565 [Streptomyces sp. NPDC002476]|uniref:hypothetical protein n=1 Tax=Streptomyces sp. NPDC002476 TaxID=3364648 RepID=UPI003694902E
MRRVIRIQYSNRHSIRGASTYDFPNDLRTAQLDLLQTRARYEEYARSLPWSVEPLPGWEGDKQLHSGYRSGKADSPGYTPDQVAEVARYREELLRLSVAVSTHPYWESLGGPGLVEARMALKHVHEQPSEA